MMRLRERLAARPRAPVPVAWALAGVIFALAPVPAFAHGGHAGPMVTFVKTKAALRAMLPEGAKITRRKEAFGAHDVTWARESLGVALDEGVYTYYLARDPASGAAVGGAIVREFEYEHAEVRLALGLDATGNVTRAALLSVNRQFVPEFEDTVGTGFLPDLAGLSPGELTERAAESEAGDEARRFALERLGEMAGVLATFLHGMQS